MIRSDKAEAPLRDLMDSLCKAKQELLEFEGCGYWYSINRLTLREVLGRVLQAKGRRVRAHTYGWWRGGGPKARLTPGNFRACEEHGRW